MLINEDNPDEGEENREVFNDDDDEEENNENLDQFETNGFIMDDEEVEEGDNDQDAKSKQEKEKKIPVKDLVPDDDDIELLQENRILGVCQFPNERKKFKWLKKTGKSPKVVDSVGPEILEAQDKK